MWQNLRTQIVTKLKNSNCDQTQNLKLWQLKNSLWKKLKPKFWHNSNYYKTQKLNLWQNAQTQYVLVTRLTESVKMRQYLSPVLLRYWAVVSFLLSYQAAGLLICWAAAAALFFLVSYWPAGLPCCWAAELLSCKAAELLSYPFPERSTMVQGRSTTV